MFESGIAGTTITSAEPLARVRRQPGGASAPPVLMPRELAFRERTGSLYRSMKQRFRERVWKSGRFAGKVRTPGRQLPFSLEDFRDWFTAKLGGKDGTRQCRYCPVILTALDAGVDHVEPVAQGGSLDLANLDLCCKTCNTLKGSLSLDGFLALKDFLYFRSGSTHKITPQDSIEIEKRLKGGVVYRKTKARFKPKAETVEEDF